MDIQLVAPEISQHILKSINEKWEQEKIHSIICRNNNYHVLDENELMHLIYSYLIGEISKLELYDSISVMINEDLLISHDEDLSTVVYNINKGKHIFADVIQSEYLKGNIKVDFNKVKEIYDFFDSLVYEIVAFGDRHKAYIVKANVEQSHQDRLSILGQMSSSFVHEFRNPLTSIMGFVRLLQGSQPDIPYLPVIMYELEQLNSRITQFLALSRREVIKEDECSFSFSNLILEILEFLYPSIVDGNIQVQYHLPPHFYISGLKGEIRQVILNLLTNAIDAVQPLQYKQLEIIMEERPDEEGILYASISNNGPKIDEHVIGKIFDPFFTTKEMGTGIGLFVCKQIINKHGGDIYCVSNNEKTTFTIKIPKVKEEF